MAESGENLKGREILYEAPGASAFQGIRPDIVEIQKFVLVPISIHSLFISLSLLIRVDPTGHLSSIGLWRLRVAS